LSKDLCKKEVIDMPVLVEKEFHTNNKTSTTIKVTNCGYIHLIRIISIFYNNYIVKTNISTQLECTTFADTLGDDLIYGIRFNQYQLRVTHICDDKLCSTDSISLDIYLQTKTSSIRLTSPNDIPPLVMYIYNQLVDYMKQNN
jgi:hypothetical protein